MRAPKDDGHHEPLLSKGINRAARSIVAGTGCGPNKAEFSSRTEP